MVNEIANLEHANINFSEIWKQVLDSYKEIKKNDVYSCFEPFKMHCLNVLHAQTKVFYEEIYVVKFFLHPTYHHVAVSLGQMILQIPKHYKLMQLVFQL